MILCGNKDNAFREKLLRESDFTLSRAISAGHAGEKTGKHVREILQFKTTTGLHKINKLRKPRHEALNEISKYIRSVSSAMAPIPKKNAQHMESHR